MVTWLTLEQPSNARTPPHHSSFRHTQPKTISLTTTQLDFGSDRADRKAGVAQHTLIMKSFTAFAVITVSSDEQGRAFWVELLPCRVVRLSDSVHV